MSVKGQNLNTVPVTAIITAWRRLDQTIVTIDKIRNCSPAPSQILVHVDGGETRCAQAIRSASPEIIILQSQESIGPGGGRNKLMEAAENDLVASFDDDSYPIDNDYFARIIHLFQRFPEAALIAASIFHRHEPEPLPLRAAGTTGCFVGCGVVYRRTAFIEAGGYVPLPVAYGMEEEDLALRMLNQKQQLLVSPWLRVFHDTDLGHHRAPQITSAQIANTALLAFLRYPARYWLYGAAQVLSRSLWSATHGRTLGLASGLAQIPGYLWRRRGLRHPVASEAIRAKLRARARRPDEFKV